MKTITTIFFVAVLGLRVTFSQNSIRELILDCDVPPIPPQKDRALDNSTSKLEPDENGVNRPCYYETWSEVTSFDEIVSLNPNNNTIWPGALIQGKSLQVGTLDLIPLRRNAGVVTLTGITFNDNKSNSSNLQSVSEQSVKDAISSMLKRPVKSTEANFSYSSSQIFSKEDGFHRVGLSANWAWGSFNTLISSSNFQSKNVFIVKLVQKYYSVSFSNPISPEDVFYRKTRIGDAQLYMGKGNPPALIDNVNYGRIIILIFETNENASNFSTALNASMGAFNVGGTVNFTEEQQRIFRSSDIKIFAIGGDASQIAKVITAEPGKDKISQLSEYIQQGAQFSLQSPGVPIGYKAVYLSNNHVAAVSSSTEFKKVHCQPAPYKKPLSVVIEKFVCRDVTDDDEDMGFSYKIDFIGQNGEQLGSFSNGQPITYVEEPSKPGNNGNHTFFVGQNKTVDAPVFKVNVTISARSDDGDCDKPWGKQGGYTYATYDYTDFGKRVVFSAWNCLDLYLKIE